MNIYQVVSEQLTDYYSIGLPELVPEPYCIAELVVARSRPQASYMAWKNDRDFELNGPDFRDKPKMSIKLCKKDVDEPVGFVSRDPRFQHLWRE